LRPYNSAGEVYFHRGAGITLRLRKMEATVFLSVRKLDANLTRDTTGNKNFISSFLNSGYHRTVSENAERNNVRQLASGGVFTYHHDNWRIALNAVYYNFSFPIQKREEPYNFFALNGKSWSNVSIDYSYSFHNLHFFGEAATDKNFHKAYIHGLLMSVDQYVDISILQRTISRQYQAVYGNAFTENTYPTNENGIYAGVSLRPATGWKIDMYADIYKFPWLKYLVDAPAYGKDFLTQVTYAAGKQLEIYFRYRSEVKQSNQPGNSTITNYLVIIPRQSLRVQMNFKVNRTWTLRERIELLRYDKNGKNEENGFLGFFDFIYKSLLKPWSANVRLLYFETGDYNSRIYTYENDVAFSYSIPAFFNKGYHYYININYDAGKKFSLWLRWMQTLYGNSMSIGSGLDEIPGNHRSEIKLQALYFF
jgi:hypothetical protein